MAVRARRYAALVRRGDQGGPPAAKNDFGYQLVKRGFVALCLGQNPKRSPARGEPILPHEGQDAAPGASYLAYVAAKARTWLLQRPERRVHLLTVYLIVKWRVPGAGP